MTVADAIRSMTDMQLAQLFMTIIDERDKIMSEKLEAQGATTVWFGCRGFPWHIICSL